MLSKCSIASSLLEMLQGVYQKLSNSWKYSKVQRSLVARKSKKSKCTSGAPLASACKWYYHNLGYQCCGEDCRHILRARVACGFLGKFPVLVILWEFQQTTDVYVSLVSVVLHQHKAGKSLQSSKAFLCSHLARREKENGLLLNASRMLWQQDLLQYYTARCNITVHLAVPFPAGVHKLCLQVQHKKRELQKLTKLHQACLFYMGCRL